MRIDKLLMIIGALLILSLFLFPLWNITLEAPQYPEPIGMDIWINKITDHSPNDIKNIDILNHYVGMKEIPREMKEFEIFPIVILIMSVIGVIIGLAGKHYLFLVWTIMMIIIGILGMYDFYLWEYDYGHNLDVKAPIKFLDDKGNPMSYQPPLIGSKMVLNFKAISMPMLGGYLMFLGIICSFIAFIKGKKLKNEKT